MVSHTPQTAPPQNVRRYKRITCVHILQGAFYESGWHRRTSEDHEEQGSGSSVTTREEIEMPLAKIHVLEGQYDEARLGRVSSAVQNGLIRALGIPPEDFFQIIHVLPRSRFLHTPSFLGLTYSDDLILLEVTFISGRPKEKRLGLLKALNDGVVSAAGISPDDLLITLYETPGENISFGRGLAQRAHVSTETLEPAYADRSLP
jgi:hypothetical protein